MENLQGDGQWIGNHVVTMNGIMPAGEMHRLPKLAIPTIDSDHLSLAHVYKLGLPRPKAPMAGRFEPRLINGDVSRIGA